MTKNEMTQSIASKIVSAVDDNGWRTAITDDAGFNRSRFDLDYVVGLDLSQQTRLYVSIAYKKGAEFKKWWNEIGDSIFEVASNSDSYYEYLDSENND
jgi:hypothetical protein